MNDSNKKDEKLFIQYPRDRDEYPVERRERLKASNEEGSLRKYYGQDNKRV